MPYALKTQSCPAERQATTSEFGRIELRPDRGRRSPPDGLAKHPRLGRPSASGGECLRKEFGPKRGLAPSRREPPRDPSNPKAEGFHGSQDTGAPGFGIQNIRQRPGYRREGASFSRFNDHESRLCEKNHKAACDEFGGEPKCRDRSDPRAPSASHGLHDSITQPLRFDAEIGYNSKIEGEVIHTQLDSAINWFRKNSPLAHAHGTGLLCHRIDTPPAPAGSISPASEPKSCGFPPAVGR